MTDIHGGPNALRRQLTRRVGVTVAVAVTALFAPALPASAIAQAEKVSQAAPIAVPLPAPGARMLDLTAGQRTSLLKAAANSASSTARSLKLSQDEKLIPKDVVKDADGTVHTRYERTYQGLPVLGGDLVVHDHGTRRTADRAVRAVISVPTIKAAVSAGTARASALAAARRAGDSKPAVKTAPRLVVWAEEGEPTLAWESFVTSSQADGTPSKLRVLTDARTGRQLKSTEQNETGVGHSQYNGTVSIDTEHGSSGYLLSDPARGGSSTMNMTATATGIPFIDADDEWGDGTPADPQTAAVDATYGAQRTWDFYHDRFGRNGIANDGVGAASYVHYMDNYANAFWNDDCFCMTYGDGLGNAHPLTELDITGHEMTHGVTSHTAGLVYSGESGGLNESTSDIMGTAVEWFANSLGDKPDFTLAELADIRGNGKPVRYMDQPSRDNADGGTSQDYWTPKTKNLDVHASSGIGNHFFYLLSEGSGKKKINGIQYNSTTYDGLPVTGIGLKNATDVWYRALTVYMTSTTDYAGARTATLEASADLFGKSSKAYESVAAAWAAVNVGPRFIHHIAVSSAAPPKAAFGLATSWQILATSTRRGALTYSVTGLPKGLSANPVTGLVSGTPEESGAFPITVTIRNKRAGLTRKIAYTWTVLPNGGNHFVNPARFDIAQWGSVESPITVSGHKGTAPATLKVSVDLYHDFIGAQVVFLVAPDGTEIQLSRWSWDYGSELHTTYTVDASGYPANGIWKLRVLDAVPGNMDYGPGYLDGWALDF
ncbi:M4 family metallopeptidase (plasmid) [Streptomyces sp. AHU1]|uniref:M4 family metallopeptidase n=1 Tax=Streptomyces sp. AHU1 TaxID=3377215 RepID=UPI003877EA23